MASPACHPLPRSPAIGSGSFRQDRCSGLPQCRRGSTTPLRFSSYIWVRFCAATAGCSVPLTEPLSGTHKFRLPLPLPPATWGELPTPWFDFNRQVIRLHGIHYKTLNLCDEIIPRMITEVHNKKGRTIADPALLKLNAMVFRYFLNFLPPLRQSNQPKTKKQHGSGSGTFTCPPDVVQPQMLLRAVITKLLKAGRSRKWHKICWGAVWWPCCGTRFKHLSQ